MKCVVRIGIMLGVVGTPLVCQAQNSMIEKLDIPPGYMSAGIRAVSQDKQTVVGSLVDESTNQRVGAYWHAFRARTGQYPQVIAEARSINAVVSPLSAQFGVSAFTLAGEAVNYVCTPPEIMHADAVFPFLSAAAYPHANMVGGKYDGPAYITEGRINAISGTFAYLPLPATGSQWAGDYAQGAGACMGLRRGYVDYETACTDVTGRAIPDLGLTDIDPYPLGSSSPVAISYDGAVTVGNIYASFTDCTAPRDNTSPGPPGLPPGGIASTLGLPPGHWGFVVNTSHGSALETSFLGPGGTDGWSWVMDVDGEGDVVVGTSFLAGPTAAWRATVWSTSGGLTGAYVTPTNGYDLGAASTAVGIGGDLIIGRSAVYGDGSSWVYVRSTHSAYSLTDYLTNHRDVDLSNWSDLVVGCISDDGKMLAGRGTYTAPGESPVSIGWAIVPDCNNNNIPDSIEILDGTAPDCNGNGIPDECDIASGEPDCQPNGIPDICEIHDGAPDCDHNGVPDECQPDCDHDGTIDPCECKVDVVFVVDTSGSMTSRVEALCTSLPAIQAFFDATAADVQLRIVTIASGGFGSTCIPNTDSVRYIFGTAVPGSEICPWDPLVAPMSLADCSEPHASREDWGAAVAILGERGLIRTPNPAPDFWRPGAQRIIMPYSDDRPRCGSDSLPDLQQDWVINLAISNCLRLSHDPLNPPVRVCPMLTRNDSPPVLPETYMYYIADQTGGRAQYIDDSILVQAVSDHVERCIKDQCPFDCDLNGVSDACQLPPPEDCEPAIPEGRRHCDPDFNGDGDAVTDADIEAFFACCLGGTCCPTCASPDFNGDGDVGTDADIESFFRMMAGGCC